MKNLKKIICLVLSLSMVLGAVAFAFADEEAVIAPAPVAEEEQFFDANLAVVEKFNTGWEALPEATQAAFAGVKAAVDTTFDLLNVGSFAEVGTVLGNVAAELTNVSLVKYDVIDAFNYPLTVKLGTLQFNFGILPYVDNEVLAKVISAVAGSVKAVEELVRDTLNTILTTLPITEVGKFFAEHNIKAINGYFDAIESVLEAAANEEEVVAPTVVLEAVEEANLALYKNFLDFVFVW